MAAAFDFRAGQRRARRGTILLVAGFLAMTAAIGVALGVVASLVLTAERGGTGTLDPQLVGAAALLVTAVVGVVAVFRILFLGGDGATVARTLGAEEIGYDSVNLNLYQRRYLNIVEELSVAAALPRPRVFVLKHEQGINAFAAGADPSRAAVAVTHGALSKLTRAELAGVVAHELAHIRNYDTRLNTRLMGLVFGLVALYVIGRGILRGMAFPGRRRNDGAAVALTIGLALVVLGSLGILAGRILQAAVSRRREYLADATGVEFTRNPAGLANALKKIGGTTAGSHIDNSHREETRHMFFAAASGALGGLFATHPPLLARIRALEPGFDPATDPVFAASDRDAMREVRRDLGLGPWDSI